MAKDLVPLRLEVAGMANRLFELVGVRPQQATEKQRQQLAAYAFGMTFALGKQHGLAPVEVHGLVMSYLRDVFHYADLQVVQFSELLIQATANPSPNPKLNAIGHRGIDGYFLLKEGKIDRLREDLHDLLGIAKKPAAKAVAPAAQNQLRAAREQVYLRFFGKSFSVNRQNGPQKPTVEVYAFEPGHAEREFYTVVTSGMSDAPMNVPEGGSGARAEIILYVDEPTEQHVNVLRWLARIPHDQGRWYCPGTTMNNGNPPQPIFEGSRLDCFFFLPTYVTPDCDLAKHLVLGKDPVSFLWLVPITSKECAFILKRGPQEFVARMTESENPIVLDEQRRSYLRSKQG